MPVPYTIGGRRPIGKNLIRTMTFPRAISRDKGLIINARMPFEDVQMTRDQY